MSPDAPESAVLCDAHWAALPGTFRYWLADSWDKPTWKYVLVEVVRELRRMEAERQD